MESPFDVALSQHNIITYHTYMHNVCEELICRCQNINNIALSNTSYSIYYIIIGMLIVKGREEGISSCRHTQCSEWEL